MISAPCYYCYLQTFNSALILNIPVMVSCTLFIPKCKCYLSENFFVLNYTDYKLFQISIAVDCVEYKLRDISGGPNKLTDELRCSLSVPPAESSFSSSEPGIGGLCPIYLSQFHPLLQWMKWNPVIMLGKIFHTIKICLFHMNLPDC